MFMRKTIIISALLMTLVFPAMSQSRFGFQGYQGGMMLHTGWVANSSVNLTSFDNVTGTPVIAEGMPFGIGGAIKIKLLPHFRVGSEGYVSTLTYEPNHSQLRVGWGGLLVDGVWYSEKWSFFVGATVGGGSVQNTTLLDPQDVNYETELHASYRRYSFMCVTPFAGCEYALTERIHLVGKIDYVTDLTSGELDNPQGPRVYVGFLFGH